MPNHDPTQPHTQMFPFVNSSKMTIDVSKLLMYVLVKSVSNKGGGIISPFP
jgi:hypothetical protein